MRAWLSTILLFALLSGCATSPTGRNQLMLVSPETAINASREAYSETLRPLEEEGLVDRDPAVNRRVRTITGRIIYQAIERYPVSSNWQWSMRVIEDAETVNAWCMAGGRMAIYTGLLDKVKPTDDELAQVIGHEIAHALANHTAEKMSVAMASQLAIAGIGLATRESRHASLALTGASLAASLAITLPNSRTAEEEADEIGMRLAALAGYDPAAAATLWGKMAAVGGDGPPEFLSTHPSPANREQRLRELANRVRSDYRPDSNHPLYRLP